MYFLFMIYLFIPSLLLSLSSLDLTLEEKVGQLLMVHFHGEVANRDAEILIGKTHIGGIIYYPWANGLTSPQQVQKLSLGLQKLAQKRSHSIPLFIAVDQEGGRVSRLKEGFTTFPGNYALGKTQKWEWGEEYAWMMGRELKAVGVNVNLAPVVDVLTERENQVIGTRAFSSNPHDVARWGSLAVQGYKRAGILATLKHFPGHGDVKVDSHEALPIVYKKREDLDKCEFVPFRSLVLQADAMMTSHLFVPSLDDVHCVTFSKKIVQGLLRNEFHFQGLILTDSLAMEGALSQCRSLEEAVLKSIEAGHDVILLGGKQLLTSQNGFEIGIEDVLRIHRFLISAVKEGRISEKRIDESVDRILAAKEKYGMSGFVLTTLPRLENEVNISSHRDLAEKIAKKVL